MQTITRRFVRRHGLAAAVALCLAGQSHAADIVVNNSSAGSVVGACTVQDAVTAVNTQAAKNGCIAGNGSNDTIDLTGFTTATTITFSASAGTVGGIGGSAAAALALSKTATITGALDSSGNPLVTLMRSTVSGTPAFSVIASSANLSVYGLAVSNGSNATHYSGGGGIFAYGASLSVSHSTLENNYGQYGGGIFTNPLNANSLTIVDSTFNGNTARYGGAANSTTTAVTGSSFSNNTATKGGGALHITNGSVSGSTFSGNSAGTYGGALDAATQYKTVTVTDSTFTGNSSSKLGGAIFAVGVLDVTGSTLNGNSATVHGGAIATLTRANATVNLTNSTISGNTAGQSGGGIYAYNATVNYSTVYANSYTTAGSKGAGLFFVHSATANSSILTGNGQYDVGASSPTMSLGGGYDVIGAGVPSPANTISCNPKLGPLANFGGPTKTLPLLTGSCAIDAGPFTPSVTTDQRGDPRPVQITAAAPRADIGAFEKQSASDPDFIFINGFGPTGSD